MGTLFIVATPIGNLEDMSLRAFKILESVDLVVCEDTRRTGLLLKHFNLKKELFPYYEENELRQIPKIIERLKSGQKVALVTDAGTPTISDPGFRLVRVCITQKINVESIPGPSAVLTALSISGLPTDKFLFLGYLPQKQVKRKKLLQSLFTILQSMEDNRLKPTVILYESPYRLIRTLTDIKEVFGDIDIVICRELTKIYQEVRREKVSESISHFSQVKPKGEFTIVF